jgi:hypothetical protein
LAKPNHVLVATVVLVYVVNLIAGNMQILARVGLIAPILMLVAVPGWWARGTNRLVIVDNRRFLVALPMAIFVLSVIVHMVPDGSILIPSLTANLLVALILASTVLLSVAD